MSDLATPDVLEKAWRPLTAAERPRAEYYLSKASRRIRRRWPDVDDRMAAQTLDSEDVEDVIVQMVLAVLDGPPIRGAKSFSEGVGPMSRSATFIAGGPDPLVIEEWMVEVFEGRQTTAEPVGSFPPAGTNKPACSWTEGRS
jgi:hypothetical protein